VPFDHCCSCNTFFLSCETSSISLDIALSFKGNAKGTSWKESAWFVDEMWLHLAISL
jgi:hypothetical protein